MNLQRLFKIKYFKENLKKSKGLLAFLFGVVPLINVILLIMIANAEVPGLLTFNDISMVIYMGLFVLPIILASTLFGFLFKQKSVDFVMAKPLSRKQIYFTNIVGGMFVIIIFVLINTLIFGLFSLLFSNINIPLELLFDYFIFYSISYIFMFMISSLAITIAGNFISSAVIVLLILLLVPTLRVINTYFGMNAPTYISIDNRLQESTLSKKIDTDFTAPLLFVRGFEVSLYNTKSMVKMAILSIVCMIIGFYTFKYRKMENNEVSFRSDFMHYFIKTLVFIPVSFVIYTIVKDMDIINIIIGLAIVFIFSVIYDLITRREIYKFRLSALISLASLVVLLGIFAVLDITMDRKRVVVKDFKSLEVNDMVIKDEDLIKRLVTNDGVNTETLEGVLNDKYTLFIKISDKDREILDRLESEELNKKIKEFDYDKISYISDDVEVNRKIKDLIKKSDKTKGLGEEDNYSIKVYSYKNHDYQVINISLKYNRELAKYVLEKQNEKNVEKLKNGDYSYQILDYDKFSNKSLAIFSYLIGRHEKEFINYLENSNKELTDNYIQIDVFGTKYFKITIGNLDKFLEVLETWEAKEINNPQYQEILKNYEENTVE